MTALTQQSKGLEPKIKKQKTARLKIGRNVFLGAKSEAQLLYSHVEALL